MISKIVENPLGKVNASKKRDFIFSICFSVSKITYIIFPHFSLVRFSYRRFQGVRYLHTFLKMNPDARKVLEEELKKYSRARVSF